MKYDILLKERKTDETIKAVALGVSIEKIPENIERNKTKMLNNIDYYIEITICRH